MAEAIAAGARLDTAPAASVRLPFSQTTVSLDDDPEYWKLKESAEEYVPALLDEHEFAFGERREELRAEEMDHERVLHARHLTLGRDLLLFVIFGPGGAGKTSLLTYLHWRLTFRCAS